MLYCTGYCTVRLAAGADFLKIVPAPQKVSFLKKSLTKTTFFDCSKGTPFAGPVFRIRGHRNPPRLMTISQPAPRIVKALAARIISKPAAVQHRYCTVKLYFLMPAAGADLFNQTAQAPETSDSLNSPGPWPLGVLDRWASNS